MNLVKDTTDPFSTCSAKPLSIVIIGCGWYGCHIASVIKQRYSQHPLHITMLDKAPDLFHKSSYYNQNRLHLGFHYPRNYATRHLCSANFTRFLSKYEPLVDKINNNYYAISQHSLLDNQTFQSIYRYEDILLQTYPT